MSDFIFTILSTAVNEETHEIACQTKCIGELVRCKDCKWFADFTDTLKILTHYEGQCRKYNRDVVMNKTDYCSYGERRESE